jgi:hypothetical protein
MMILSSFPKLCQMRGFRIVDCGFIISRDFIEVFLLVLGLRSNVCCIAQRYKMGYILSLGCLLCSERHIN